MKKYLIIVIAVILVVIGIVAAYLYERQPQQPVAAPVAISELPMEQPVPEEEPAAPAEGIPRNVAPAVPELEELPLPELADSDEYARETVSEVVGEAGAIQYFSTEGLVARVVATVDALSSRQVPGNIQAMTGPGGDYAAVPDPAPAREILDEAGDPIPQFTSDPANASRYRPYVEMLEAVDADHFAALYDRNEPLFEQAWRQLGYTDKAFDERLVEVIDELLATPAVPEPYALIKPEAYYLFADEDLEALTAGQKILLRMGADNASRVKSKLLEFRQALAEIEQE